MKTLAKYGAIILIGIAYFAFPGLDWRHFLLLAAQAILIVLVLKER